MNISCREVALLVIDVLLSRHIRFFSVTLVFAECCVFIMLTETEIFYVFNSSRTKNMMWYGVLGTKELVQKTYKNLEQRVQLEV